MQEHVGHQKIYQPRSENFQDKYVIFLNLSILLWYPCPKVPILYLAIDHPLLVLSYHLEHHGISVVLLFMQFRA